MASQVRDRQGNYLVAFRYAGKQFTRSLGTTDPAVAAAGVARTEETILRLKRGWLTLPPDADPGIFIASGGQLTSKPVVESFEDRAHSTTLVEVPATIESLLNLYARHLTPGSKGVNTLETEAIHRTHLISILGKTGVESFGLNDLDRYVKTRAEIGRDAVTIKKEIATLRLSWNWGFKRGHAAVPWTWKLNDLHFPKQAEKEPFRTWSEIERRISAGVSTERARALWECLYLDESQVTECLAWVRENARHPFVHPMFCFAAYTGARLGEILRSERDDFDFGNRTVAIRETKGDTSKDFTTRHVRLHPAFIEVMKAWFNVHPGGRYTITTDGRNDEMLPRMASKYFRQAVSGGKWRVLHGFHVFRHSLASIMASSGKDQRVIDTILGHSTEDMTRRYRHLFPSTQHGAIDDLFR